VAHRAQNSVGLLFLAKQIWQLGNIRRNPPRFIFGEQLGRRSVVTVGTHRRTCGNTIQTDKSDEWV
jgi:hypothetical protein